MHFPSLLGVPQLGETSTGIVEQKINFLLFCFDLIQGASQRGEIAQVGCVDPQLLALYSTSDQSIISWET
ncbi:hypothetical protein D3C75_761890 [compost metagenome]